MKRTFASPSKNSAKKEKKKKNGFAKFFALQANVIIYLIIYEWLQLTRLKIKYRKLGVIVKNSHNIGIF